MEQYPASEFYTIAMGRIRGRHEFSAERLLKYRHRKIRPRLRYGVFVFAHEQQFVFDFEEPFSGFVEFFKVQKNLLALGDAIGVPEKRGEHQQRFGVSGIAFENFVQKTFRLEPIALEVLRNGVGEEILFRVGVLSIFVLLFAIVRDLAQKIPRKQDRPETVIPSRGRQKIGPVEVEQQPQVQNEQKRQRNGQKRPSTVAQQSANAGE